MSGPSAQDQDLETTYLSVASLIGGVGVTQLKSVDHEEFTRPQTNCVVRKCQLKLQ